MDKKKALYNIIVSLFFKIIVLLFSLISRRYLINALGDETNGVYSLFVSIIGFLSVADLGIGSAISFSLYKPVVENDKDTVSGLYYLYKKIYNIISIIILTLGLSIAPFVPMLAKGNSGNINISFNYILFLLATLLSYGYAYKTSFINAHKDNYLTTSIRSIGQIIEFVLQIIILIYMPLFELFIFSIIISNGLQWVLTNHYFSKNYRNRINNNRTLSKKILHDVFDKTKAMFSHKIGGLLVNTLNGIIISFFIGVVILGKYSNYLTILTGVNSILTLVFVAITSVLGHSFAKNSKEVFYKQFMMIFTFNFIIGVIFYLGFISISDELISLIFSSDQIIDRSIVIVLTINYFIQFMRQTTLTFKDASGTFYQDRYKPILEGVVNLSLSLFLVGIIGINGVLISTIITNLFICHIIEPYVLFKYAFGVKVRNQIMIQYTLIIVFVLSVYLFESLTLPMIPNQFMDLILKGGTSVLLSFLSIMVIYLVIKPIRSQINIVIKRIIEFIKSQTNQI